VLLQGYVKKSIDVIIQYAFKSWLVRNNISRVSHVSSLLDFSEGNIVDINEFNRNFINKRRPSVDCAQLWTAKTRSGQWKWPMTRPDLTMQIADSVTRWPGELVTTFPCITGERYSVSRASECKLGFVESTLMDISISFIKPTKRPTYADAIGFVRVLQINCHQNTLRVVYSYRDSWESNGDHHKPKYKSAIQLHVQNRLYHFGFSLT